MVKVNHNITQNQYIHLLQSSMIGLGILAIGSGATKDAHQSAWIPVLLMGIYPIFMVLCSSYIDKKTGHIQYWEMSTKIYGKTLTYIFTFAFFVVFFMIVDLGLAGFANILLFTLTPYLPAKLALFLLLLLAGFIVMDGLTYIGRLVEMLFTLMVILMVTPLVFYHDGSMINVKPFIDSIDGIVAALPTCLYPYIGAEITFFITPFIVNPTNIKKAGMMASLFVIVFYTFYAFSIIYYAGWEVVSRTRLPLLFLLRTISVPILTDFRAIFVFLWSLELYKVVSTLFFGAAYCSMKIFHVGYKKMCLLLLPLMYYIGTFFLIESKRRVYVDIVCSYAIMFIISWSLLTILIVHIKFRGDKREKS